MFVVILIALVAFALLAFEFAAVRWGYDSRDDFGPAAQRFNLTRR